MRCSRQVVAYLRSRISPPYNQSWTVNEMKGNQEQPSSIRGTLSSRPSSFNQKRLPRSPARKLARSPARPPAARPPHVRSPARLRPNRCQTARPPARMPRGRTKPDRPTNRPLSPFSSLSPLLYLIYIYMYPLSSLFSLIIT